MGRGSVSVWGRGKKGRRVWDEDEVDRCGMSTYPHTESAAKVIQNDPRTRVACVIHCRFVCDGTWVLNVGRRRRRRNGSPGRDRRRGRRWWWWWCGCGYQGAKLTIAAATALESKAVTVVTSAKAAKKFVRRSQGSGIRGQELRAEATQQCRAEMARAFLPRISGAQSPDLITVHAGCNIY